MLVSFIVGLHLALSRPQREHILRTADAIIVCEERKTLSALYRQWVEAPDVSAVADCFRVSPWTAEEVRQGSAEFVMTDLARWAVLAGVAPIIFVSIDDSLTRKDKDTTHLEAVDVVHDHAAAGKGQTAYCKGAVHVTCRVQIGEWGYTQYP